MMGVDILGDRVICPSCQRVTEADLFYDRHGELRCGQCATGPRRRRTALIPLVDGATIEGAKELAPEQKLRKAAEYLRQLDRQLTALRGRTSRLKG
jgi:hypothetical protein